MVKKFYNWMNEGDPPRIWFCGFPKIFFLGKKWYDGFFGITLLDKKFIGFTISDKTYLRSRGNELAANVFKHERIITIWVHVFFYNVHIRLYNKKDYD